MSLPVQVWSVQSRVGGTGASLAGVAATRGPKRRQRLDGVWNWLPKSACGGGQSWRPHQRKQHIGSRHRETGCSAGGLDHVTAKRRIPEPMRPISVHRRSPVGAANEGQPQFAASRMGVGPLHTIDEVAEGNEAMEKRERQ